MLVVRTVLLWIRLLLLSLFQERYLLVGAAGIGGTEKKKNACVVGTTIGRRIAVNDGDERRRVHSAAKNGDDVNDDDVSDDGRQRDAARWRGCSGAAANDLLTAAALRIWIGTS